MRGGKIRHLFVDNSGDHDIEGDGDEMLATSRMELRFLPPNSTDLCQPLDSFPIKKVKSLWRKYCAEEQRRLMTGKKKSGTLMEHGRLVNFPSIPRLLLGIIKVTLRASSIFMGHIMIRMLLEKMRKYRKSRLLSGCKLV